MNAILNFFRRRLQRAVTPDKYTVFLLGQALCNIAAAYAICAIILLVIV